MSSIFWPEVPKKDTPSSSNSCGFVTLQGQNLAGNCSLVCYSHSGQLSKKCWAEVVFFMLSMDDGLTDFQSKRMASKNRHHSV